MTQTTHTPGPWATDGREAAWDILDGDNKRIASVWRNAGKPQDARLIAAAPDMLKALEALHACHRAFSDNENWTILDDEARNLAETAIAKAKGQ